MLQIIKEVVQRAGYPFERRTVTTVDGHVLVLERLPKCDSNKVQGGEGKVTGNGLDCLLQAVLLVHGVFDSSHSWVGNGAGGGLAMMLFDRGYDGKTEAAGFSYDRVCCVSVYLGNLRGTRGKLHVDPNISLNEYWNFSLDEVSRGFLRGGGIFRDWGI